MADLATLDTFARAARDATGRGPPPVHLWNPPFCGDIDMRIAADGTWFYKGSPIGRPALVRLFASILRRDDDRYVLVTPVERVGIQVDDAPFLAVEMILGKTERGRMLRFRTNVDDWIEADADNPLRFEQGAADGLKPYVHIRRGLWARLTRSLVHDLVALGETETIEGREMFGVRSGGVFFGMAEVAALAQADKEI